MGRMSPIHNPVVGLVSGHSVGPASRNGGSSNADVNGATLDLAGKRGVFFMVHRGALTGAAAVAARIQTNDLPEDPSNGNWADANYTLYPNAVVANNNSANSTSEMDWNPAVSGARVVRAVLTPEGNVSLAGISHVIF